jgi:hypothetical protein
MTMPITDKSQIVYLLNMCDEDTTRFIIGEDDPWGSHTQCGYIRTDTKCYR